MKDLGTLGWETASNNRFKAIIDDLEILQDNNSYPDGICSIYKGATPNNYINSDDCFHFSSSIHAVYIRDTSYSSASEFTTAMSGVQLVYELATPIEVQLSPVQIQALQGINNLWCDTGDISVDYAADLKTYIDNAIAQLA